MVDQRGLGERLCKKTDMDRSTLCLRKNDTDVAHYNFNTRHPILVIFGRDVAERACYRMVICYSTFPN